jgi:hypothetical protein
MPSYEMLPLIFMGVEIILFENNILKMYLLNTHLSLHMNGVFFAGDVSDMGYQPGGEIMASLLPVVTHMQNLSY